MTFIPPQLKHNILTHIQTNPENKTQKQIVGLYGINVSKQTINKWFHKWNGTAASLERKIGSGRQHILTNNEIKKYIETPIRKQNRAGEKVKYTNITDGVREKTGKQVSLSTIQKIGKKQLGGRLKKGIKRTVEESK